MKGWEESRDEGVVQPAGKNLNDCAEDVGRLTEGRESPPVVSLLPQHTRPVDHNDDGVVHHVEGPHLTILFSHLRETDDAARYSEAATAVRHAELSGLARRSGPPSNPLPEVNRRGAPREGVDGPTLRKR